MFHTFKLGSHTCMTLLDMSGEWDIYALFSPCAKDELDPLLAQSGKRTTWPRHGSVLLVDTGPKKILFDTGLPSARGGQLISNLQAAGLSPSDIDLVFITHGDGDHIGGLSNFTQAEIVIPRASYQLWTEDEAGMVEEFSKLFKARATAEALDKMIAGRQVYPQSLPSMQDRIRLADPGDEFLPGMRFIPAPGHRRDHVIVEIESEGEKLLHIADGLRHPMQTIRPELYSFLDSYPKQLAVSTRMILNKAAATKGLVFGAHIPFPGLIKIERNGNRYQWVSV